MLISRISLHEETVARIRAMILEGELGAGSRIGERELCDRFGISRTPLREALKVLASEGLVELLPHRGARVTALSAAELRDAFEVVAALEGLAGELACARISEAELAGIEATHVRMAEHYHEGDLAGYFRCNQAIHEAINRAAGNAQLTEMYALVSNRVRRARYLANHSPERWAEAMREHDEILDALKRRDGARCNALLRAHLAHKLYTIGAMEERAAEERAAR
ncbi:MAG TPA: GntR family transcriptional regulator [Candidatus Elarobacter sp.]|nr:GntR family transcriptional regulator [Candidatus Elarobacter sp.]